jgi:hypothetical protein
MDVKSAFLNGVIQEEVYVRQPQVSRTLSILIVYNLLKALYGLKQIPQA